MKTILVCGSRDWHDANLVRLVLMYEPTYQEWDDLDIRIIHGGCRGADTIAGRIASDLGYDVKAFPADWQRYGKRAGRIRNIEMLDQNPDLVIAFGEGRGTDITVTEAEKRGLPVVRFG